MKSVVGAAMLLVGTFQANAQSAVEEPIKSDFMLSTVYLYYSLASMCEGYGYDANEIEYMKNEVKRLTDDSLISQEARDKAWSSMKKGEAQFQQQLTFEKCLQYKVEAQRFMPSSFNSSNPF